MSNIGGKKKEASQFPESTKKVGLFEGRVVAINPTMEECKEVLGFEPKEDSKSLEYLGESKDGNTSLRIDVWVEEKKTSEKFKVTFFIEDKDKENKDGTKKQYINNIGTTSWAESENSLPEWFKGRDYRVAKVGEEDLYNFLRTWLGNLDYRDAETILELDWKKLMKGNLKDLKEQIDSEWTTDFVSLATIKTVIKEDDTKEYQSIFNKAFLPSYALKQFRLRSYDDADLINALSKKKSKDLKIHERFAVSVAGEYGCKDFYILKDMKEYSSEDNLVASDKAISDEGSDY